MTIIESRKLAPVDGFDIRAELVPDDTMFYEDIPEVYDAEDRAAYMRGEWDYVELVVIASRADIDLGTASLSGTDHGYIPGAPGYSDPLRDSRIESYGLVDEAIAEAQAKLAELLEGVKK